MTEYITFAKEFEVRKYQYFCYLVTRIYRLAVHDSKKFCKIDTSKIDYNQWDYRFQIWFDKTNKNYPHLKYYFENSCGFNCLSFYIEFDDYDFRKKDFYEDLTQKIYKRLTKKFKNDDNVSIVLYGSDSIGIQFYREEAVKEFFYCYDKLEKNFSIETVKQLRKQLKPTIETWHKKYIVSINKIVLSILFKNSIKEFIKSIFVKPKPEKRVVAIPINISLVSSFGIEKNERR